MLYINFVFVFVPRWRPYARILNLDSRRHTHGIYVCVCVYDTYAERIIIKAMGMEEVVQSYYLNADKSMIYGMVGREEKK